MRNLIILTFLSAAATASILLFSKHDDTELISSPNMIQTPEQHRRTPDQTFLTYPEWFLVFSPDEFATYTANHPAHQFPFFGHLRQFWEAYAAVNKYIFKRYPFNFGYHVMVIVIGGSTTVEYVLRSCYENTVGRLSWATTGHTFSEEDQFAAVVAREYVDFIKVTPWYEFDFYGKLKALWKQNPATGKNMLRKWERRYVLSTEYGVKAIYGWLIKKATKASYEEPILYTGIVVDHEFSLLPRYDAFKDAAMTLALEGKTFQEIAGNDGVIMITCLLPVGKEFSDQSSQILFTQTILTNRSIKRLAIVTPVSNLGNLLRTTHSTGITLEHIYDY